MTAALLGALGLLVALALGGLGLQWRCEAQARRERVRRAGDPVASVMTSTRLQTARCECGATVFADQYGEPLPHVGCAAEEAE